MNLSMPEKEDQHAGYCDTTNSVMRHRCNCGADGSNFKHYAWLAFHQQEKKKWDREFNRLFKKYEELNKNQGW